MSMHLTVIPKVSEKAYASAQNNVYVFVVPMNANKQQIASAVKSQYGVQVTDVNVVIQKGKPVRASRGKRAYPGTAYRTRVKKAYVSLAEGSSISVFDEEEKK